MRLCASVLLLLVLLRTWTRANPRPDHHGTDHGVNHAVDHAANHGSDQQTEECSKFNSALSLEDKTHVMGRFNFLVGYTDNELYKTLLGLTTSFWFKVSQTQSGLRLTQFNKMNTTCIESRANATLNGDTATVWMQDIRSDFQFVNSSRTAMILNITASASDITSFIQKLNLDPAQFSTTLNARSFYLMGREAEVSETDMKLFKEHAKCAGFTREPDYIHKPQQEYCSEEESILTIY